MDHAQHAEIPLPSEYPGRADPSPASRDPLNSLICAILDPYRTIEEIAEDRRITVMTLGEILSAEPASSTIETLRKVFALRAEMLALHARASAVGTLTRIANSGKDDEVARRAATTLLRMFRPDGTPSSPVTDGGGAESARRRGSSFDRAPTIADRAPVHAPTEPRPSGSGPHPTPRSRDDRANQGPERSRSSSSSDIPAPSGPLPHGRGSVESAMSWSTSSTQPTPHADIFTTPTSPRATSAPPAQPSEPRGAGGAASPSGSAHPPPILHHRRARHDDGVEEDARPPPCSKTPELGLPNRHPLGFVAP